MKIGLGKAGLRCRRKNITELTFNCTRTVWN